MKHIKNIFGVVLMFGALTLVSCVGDLNVTPIDPKLNTADKALTTAEDFDAFMAQVYTGYVTSGSYGPDGACNIKNVDGGYSQYLRALLYLEELPTDVAICNWDDKTIKDLHNFCWSNSDEFVYSFYCRIFYQISMCNEFIRQALKTEVSIPNKDKYIAEARALRAYSYYHAIDLFGNVPFADETASVGNTAPEQMTRAELFAWLETELKDLIDGTTLPDATGDYKYYRVNKDFARCILAKLYLNAEVYIGKAMYNECAQVCKSISGYSLHNSYAELFMADNDETSKDEIIFGFSVDGEDTKSYGATNFVIFACTGGKMDPASLGVASGWGGIRTTPEFYDKFDVVDARAMFHTEDQTKDITANDNFQFGYAMKKFTNMRSDGGKGKADGFVDTDWPVFRYSDVLLMMAECGLRGSSISKSEGLGYLNQVRNRAGLNNLAEADFTLNEMINERGRELYLEGWRRSDLIRFGMFTEDTYVWQWKGGVHDGKGVDAHYALFPIPTKDMQSNPNLTQNPGYGE